jgi:hypothetical protein
MPSLAGVRFLQPLLYNRTNIVLDLLECLVVFDHSAPVGGDEVIIAFEFDLAVDALDSLTGNLLVVLQPEEHGFPTTFPSTFEGNARGLKSLGLGCTGSTPVVRTKYN